MLNKRLSMVAVVFAVVSFSGVGHAGVVYNWTTETNTFDLDSIVGQVEVTESAWLSGSVNAELDNQGLMGSAFPDSPLLNLDLTVNGKEFQILPRDPTSGTIGSGDFSLDAFLIFDGTNPATGSIVANNTESDINFGSRDIDPLWTIASFNSSDPEAGCFLATCQGATGFWQIDASTIPTNGAVAVAEPQTVLLFLAALAMTAGFAARRTSV